MTKKLNKMNGTEEKKELTYLEKIAQTREQNLSFLTGLGITQIDNPFAKRPKIEKEEESSAFKKYYLRAKKAEPRRSSRLQNLPPKLIKETLRYKTNDDTFTYKKDKKKGPLLFKDTKLDIQGSDSESDFTECFKAITTGQKSKSSLYQSYEEKFKQMQITEGTVAKLGSSKVIAVAIHPSVSPILVCSASMSGEIGFFNVTSKEQNLRVQVYVPHSDRVSCLAFSPYNLNEMFSSSFDGSVRCADLQSMIFDEIYETEDEMCSSFDFIDESSLLVSKREGTVSVVDRRDKKQNGKNHRTHPDSLRTVSIHPIKKQYFVASGKNGIISLWDMRNLGKTSITDIVHPKSCHGAYFSPLSGNSLLTTCFDNTLRVYDSTSLTKDIELKVAISHNNFTGRWLTPFQAIWLPNDENAFVVGSMLHPRRIEIFGVDGKLIHNFHGDALASVCARNAFHQVEPVLAGGNASGKIHVFMNQS